MKGPKSNTLVVLLLAWIACMLIGVVPAAADTITLSLVPSSDTIQVGDTMTVDLVASGFGENAPPSIGRFDVDIHWDAAILSLDSVEFGPFLGDPTDPAETTVGLAIPDPTYPLVWVAEDSHLLPATLDALQGSSVPLVTLGFSGVGVGSSSIGGFTYLIEDAFENELCGFFAGPDCDPDSISVNVSAVPEPSSFIAFAVGAFVVSVASRKKPLTRN